MNTEYTGRSHRRCSAGDRFRWLRLFLLALVQVSLFVLPLATALAVSNTFYLKGDGVPTASVSLNSPTASTLPSHDPGRNDFPGLLLNVSDLGVKETDPTKYQLWVAPATGIDLDGPASLNFWSAIEDFRDNKKGVVEAYLLDCTPSGIGCNLIGSGSKTLDPWSSSGSWVSRTISFGAVTYTVPVGRSLAVKVVVGKDSDREMWFAYDTAAYPSKLIVQLATPATTTTTTTTTTTVSPVTTTTTTVSPTTTTTTTTVPPTTTTTTVPPTTTTTTVPPTTTTTTVPPTTTTLTTSTTTPGATTTTSPPVIPENSPQPDQPGDQSGGNDDVALAPLPNAVDVETSAPSGVSSRFIDGLELVIPPSVAIALVSPLLLLEAFVGAFADGGRALLLPGVLLLLGTAWVANESRILALFGALRRRRTGTER